MIELSDAPLPLLTAKGLGFNSQDEKEALKIIEERLKGNIVNKNGQILEINKAFPPNNYSSELTPSKEPIVVPDKDEYVEIKPKNIKSVSVLNSTPNPSLGSERHIKPGYIRVKRASGFIEQPDLYNYVRHVIPYEWYPTDPIEALKAGAMAAKMFGWYRCWYAKYPDLGFDVHDDDRDQTYNPEGGRENNNTKEAVFYIEGVSFDNSDGYIFEGQYLDESAEGSGKVSQSGSVTLANEGKNWVEILHRYYDYSDKSSGVIAPFFYKTNGWSSNGDVLSVGSPSSINGEAAKWFKVNISYSGYYDLFTTWISSSNKYDTFIELYDSNLNFANSSDDDLNGYYYSRISDRYLFSGTTYYLKVRNYSKGNSTYSNVQITPSGYILGTANGELAKTFTVTGYNDYRYFETSYYSTNSDTYLTVTDQVTGEIFTNDDGAGNYYSRLGVYLSQGRTYTVTVRNYDQTQPVYAKVKWYY